MSKKRKTYSAAFKAPIITAQGVLAAQRQDKTISQLAAPQIKTIQWHFNVEKARAKLKSLYPIIE